MNRVQLSSNLINKRVSTKLFLWYVLCIYCCVIKLPMHISLSETIVHNTCFCFVPYQHMSNQRRKMRARTSCATLCQEKGTTLQQRK